MRYLIYFLMALSLVACSGPTKYHEFKTHVGVYGEKAMNDGELDYNIPGGFNEYCANEPDECRDTDVKDGLGLDINQVKNIVTSVNSQMPWPNIDKWDQQHTAFIVYKTEFGPGVCRDRAATVRWWLEQNGANPGNMSFAFIAEDYWLQDFHLVLLLRLNAAEYWIVDNENLYPMGSQPPEYIFISQQDWGHPKNWVSM